MRASTRRGRAVASSRLQTAIMQGLEERRLFAFTVTAYHINPWDATHGPGSHQDATDKFMWKRLSDSTWSSTPADPAPEYDITILKPGLDVSMGVGPSDWSYTARADVRGYGESSNSMGGSGGDPIIGFGAPTNVTFDVDFTANPPGFPAGWFGDAKGYGIDVGWYDDSCEVMSEDPVGYANGGAKLAFDWFGTGSMGGGQLPTGVNWSNKGAGPSSVFSIGNNLQLGSLPYLQDIRAEVANLVISSSPLVTISTITDHMIGIAWSGSDHEYVMKPTGRDWLFSNPSPTKGSKVEFTANGTTGDTYEITRGDGWVYTFAGFNSVIPVAQRGQLLNTVGPGGETLETVWSSGVLVGTIWTGAGSSSGQTEELNYAYISSTSTVSSIELKRNYDNGQGNQTVRTVELQYYGSSEANGSAGDLKFAIVHDGSVSGPVIDKQYYRWYKSGESNGFTGGLKLWLSGDSFEHAVEELGSESAVTGADDFDSSGNPELVKYANNHFMYDSTSNKVTYERALAAGVGCTCGNTGAGAYKFEYAANNASWNGGRNVWRQKTIEYLPDSTNTDANGDGVIDSGSWSDNDKNIVYTNKWGQPIIKVFEDVSEAKQYITWYRYDVAGRRLIKASPSAVSKYSELYPDLVKFDPTTGKATYLNDSGLVEVTSYYVEDASPNSTGEYYMQEVAPSAGLVGYEQATYLQRGDIVASKVQLTAQTYTDGGTSNDGVYFVDTFTSYTGGDGDDAVVTTYDYAEWHSGTTQVKRLVTKLPNVAHTQNGADTVSGGSSNNYKSEQVYSQTGQVVWEKDASGAINYFEYDSVTGRAVKSIIDVNTSSTSDFSNLPSGWSNTSGLHLKTLTSLDVEGRVTKQVDPNNNTTCWTYDDSTADGDPRETRVYRGWNSTTNLPAGAIEVLLDDPSRGIRDSLTFTWSGSGGLTVNGNGAPTGVESLSSSSASLQSLQREIYNVSKQVIETRSYYNLVGLTYDPSSSGFLALGSSSNDSTSGNYHTTNIRYDERGRVWRVAAATGTITHSVFDGLGRVTAMKLGTDDGSGTSNMRTVTENEYDYGGIGDGNLTKVISYPDPTASTGARTTKNWYDWRNRLVVSKSGVESSEGTTTQRTLSYAQYNNAGQVTLAETYDGDNIYTPIAAPTAPSISNAGFESPTLTGGTYDDVPAGASWTFSDESGIASNGSALNNVSAPQGTQVGYLFDSTDDETGYLEQTLNSWPAGRYIIGFKASADSVNPNQVIQVFVDSELVDVFPLVEDDFTAFTTVPVTLASGNHTIRFQSRYEDGYAFLDDVSVAGVAPDFADSDNDRVPDQPSIAQRRSKTTNSYDDQGRMFKSQRFSVDPADGEDPYSGNTEPQRSLNTYTWYDLRGNVMKTQQPGGLVTKNAYDGANRLSTTYQCDGGGDTVSGASGTFGSADDVSGDKVTQQTEYSYDSNGNVILSTVRQRFHNTTGTGDLTDNTGSTTSGARVSYAANYYDAVGRNTLSVNPGTNLGSAYAPIAGKATSGSTTTLVDTGLGWANGAHMNDVLSIVDGQGVGLRAVITGYNSSTHTITFSPAAESALNSTSRYVVTDAKELLTSYDYKTDELQTLKFTGSPTGGTFTLTFGSETTGAITYSTTAATLATNVQTALASLSNIGSGNVVATSNSSGIVVVKFTGTLTMRDVAQMTATPSLTGGTSPNITITTSISGQSGSLARTTDPRGLVTLNDVDRAGRTVRTVEGYTDGDASSSDDRITQYTFDGSNHVLTLRAVLPSGTFQETKYIYAATTGGGSYVNSNDILTAIQYPDKSSGSASSGEQETYKVNALGELTSKTDRNGNVHAYSYDVLGRLLDDNVTTLGSGVDGNVRLLRYSYNTQGLLDHAISYGTTVAGSLRNDVLREYNGLGHVTKEYQNHSAAVNTSTSPRVEYAYTEMASDANHSRLARIIYPNGRIVRYEYSSGLDSDISRISFLADDSSGSVGTPLEEYTYLGAGTVVKRNRPEPGTSLSYIGASSTASDSGDWYSGFDRFGRVIDQKWNDGTNDIDRFKFGYDQDSNVLYKDNTLTDSLTGANEQDELYHANGASAGYDTLNRLTDFKRGELSDSNSDGIPDTVSTTSRTQSWTLDALGNWNTLNTNGTNSNKTHNKQNQLTNNGSAAVSYDNNGSMLKVGTASSSPRYTYDAWNRLVRYDNGSGFSIETWKHTFDSLGRRATEFYQQGTITPKHKPTDLYYSTRWQVLEEVTNFTSSLFNPKSVTVQNIWSPFYVDEMILRDRSSTGFDSGLMESPESELTDDNESDNVVQVDGTGGFAASSAVSYDSSVPDGRLYAQQDANYNVTSITDDAGAIVERYKFDPYGSPMYMDSTFSDIGSSAYGWQYLHQGGRYDSNTGLYHFRNRELRAADGRWLQVDPLGYPDGMNRNAALVSSPTNSLDPVGLEPSFNGNGQVVTEPRLDTDVAGVIAQRQREIAESAAVAAADRQAEHAQGEERRRLREAAIAALEASWRGESSCSCYIQAATPQQISAAGSPAQLAHEKVVLHPEQSPPAMVEADEILNANNYKFWPSVRDAFQARGPEIAAMYAGIVSLSTGEAIYDRWRPGDPISRLTAAGNNPSWSAIRSRFWKNMACRNLGGFTAENIGRMRSGLAPQRRNPITGRLESMELHHDPPQREGGLYDVTPVWPSEHADIDPFRILGGS